MNVQERVNHILRFQWQQTNSFLLSSLENYKFQINIGSFECLCLHKYLNICMHITHVCTLEQIVQQNTIKVEYRPSSGKTSKQGRDTKLKENLSPLFL